MDYPHYSNATMSERPRDRSVHYSHENYVEPYSRQLTTRYGSPGRNSYDAGRRFNLSPDHAISRYRSQYFVPPNETNSTMREVIFESDGNTGSSAQAGASRQGRREDLPRPSVMQDDFRPVRSQSIAEIQKEIEHLRARQSNTTEPYSATTTFSKLNLLPSQAKERQHVIESELAAERARLRAVRGREELMKGDARSVRGSHDM